MKELTPQQQLVMLRVYRTQLNEADDLLSDFIKAAGKCDMWNLNLDRIRDSLIELVKKINRRVGELDWEIELEKTKPQTPKEAKDET